MESKENIVHASEGVTVLYQDYFLSAKSATYNRTTGELELFDNIRVNYKGTSKILGKYAKLNIAKKEKYFKPFYMLDKDSKVWISAQEGESLDKDYFITSGAVSGCDPTDPLWNMEFSSLDYDGSDKWMNVYNMRLYFGDIPVFYTPYFGYSLDKTRRTGLLMPSIGLSSAEGVFFSESLYIAEQNWWDLEITPQIRTSRGAGAYSTFRFVDSPVSHGEITLGYFKEKDTYYKENKLENISHSGFDFLYDNKDFINQWFGTNFDGQSGIYADIHLMNDVDYINLKSSNTIEQATSQQVLSRVNMFYNTDDHYVGAYFKYYLDLSKPSNEETLQKLPTLQYHYYLDTLLEDHFIYSLDLQSNNIQRQLGTSVVQTDLNIPLTLQTNMFDEYLNLSYDANIYAQHSAFRGESTSPLPTPYEDGYILRNDHTFSANTQLTRGFENFTHVAGFGVSYTVSGGESRDGYYEDYKDSTNEFYKISPVQESTQLDFIQYIYNSSAEQIVYHRLSQNISYEQNATQYGELENELDYKITSYLSYYNNMFYNFDEKKLSKMINRATLNGAGVRLSLSHLYKNNFALDESNSAKYTSYLTSTASYRYNKHYLFSAKYDYDIELDTKKNMEIGFMYTKRCWDFGIRYAENNRPILTTTGADNSIYDKYVYFTIVLKPFMQPSASQNSLLSYKLPE
jgi:LPS-assembly protein